MLFYKNIDISVLSFEPTMKLLVKIFLFSLIFQLSFGQSAYDCYMIIDGYQSIPFIDEGDEVYISIDKLIFVDEEKTILQRSKVFEDYRAHVESYFDCAYSLDALPNFGDFKIIPFSIEEDEEDIFFIREDLLKIYYIIYQGFAFRLAPCNQAELCEDEYHYNPEFQFVKDSIRKTKDTLLININESEFETVTEQVLVKEAFNILQISDIVFDTIPSTFLVEQIVTCPNTNPEFEIQQDSFVMVEAHSLYQAFPPKFEPVFEQYQIKSPHSVIDTFSLQIALEEEEIILKEAYSNWTWNIIDSVGNFSTPNDCMYFQMENFAAETMTVSSLNYIDACPADYDLAGNICLGITLAPAHYETRSYLKLDQPAFVMERFFEAQYYNYDRKVISNSEEIGSECIDIKTETINALKLKTPQTITIKSFDAKYTTISREILKNNLTLSITEMPGQYVSFTKEVKVEDIDIKTKSALCEPLLTEAMKEKIIARMSTLQLINSDTNFGSALFWDAVFNYQQAKQLAFGNIDIDFIKKLGIE